MAAWPDLSKHNLVLFQEGETAIVLARLDKNSDIQGVELDSILSLGFNEGSPGVFSFDALSGKINLAQFRSVFKDGIFRDTESMTHGIRLSLSEYYNNEVNPQWLWASKDDIKQEAGNTRVAALTAETLYRYTRNNDIVLLPKETGPFSVLARDEHGAFVIGDKAYMEILRQDKAVKQSLLSLGDSEDKEASLRQNFGEKIGGSAADRRRASAANYTQIMVDDPYSLDAKDFLLNNEIKLSKIWPKPDLGDLLEQGIHPVIVATVGYIYENLPKSPATISFLEGVRPKKYYQAVTVEAEAARALRYAIVVDAIRGRCEKMIKANEFRLDLVAGDLGEGGNPSYDNEAFSRCMQKNGISMWTEDLFTWLKENAILFKDAINEIPIDYAVGAVMPFKKEFSLDSWGLSNSGLLGLLSNHRGDSAPKRPLLLTSSERFLDEMLPLPEGGEGVSLEEKRARYKILGQRRMAKSFVNLTALHDLVNEALHKGELNKEGMEKEVYKMLPSFIKKEGKKEIPDIALTEAVTPGKKMPSMHFSKFERTGPPVIPKGHLVTEEFFMETFGFRAIEYGEWVSQTDRQKMLESAFESFMDMANAMNVPPKFMGLENTLAIAFGARGRGGKNAALAHYEHDRAVINLTKLTKDGGSGGGTIAHEWVHALDGYLEKHPIISRFMYGPYTNTNEYKKRRPNLSESMRRGTLYSMLNESQMLSSDEHKVLTLAVEMLKFLGASKSLDKLQDLLGDETSIDLKDLIDKSKNTTLNDSLKLVADTTLKGILSSDVEDFIGKNLEPEEQKKMTLLFEYIARQTAEKMVSSNQDDNTVFSSLLIRGRYKYSSAVAENELCKHYKTATNENPTERIEAFIEKLATHHLTFKNWKSTFKEARSVAQKTNNVKCKTDFFRDAESLDATRKSPYWATERELLARVLSYAIDELMRKNGVINDFASLISRAGLFDRKEVIASPNPEGREAELIKMASTPLFQSLSTYAHGLHSEIKKSPSHSPN